MVLALRAIVVTRYAVIRSNGSNADLCDSLQLIYVEAKGEKMPAGGVESLHPRNAVHSHYANGTNRAELNKIDARYLIPPYFSHVMYLNVCVERGYVADIFNGTNVVHKHGIIHRTEQSRADELN